MRFQMESPPPIWSTTLAKFLTRRRFAPQASGRLYVRVGLCLPSPPRLAITGKITHPRTFLQQERDR